MQHHAADQLHVEMPHPQHPAGRLAHHGEGFRQQIVQGGALPQPLAEFRGLAAQSLIRQSLHRGLMGIDLRYPPLIRLQGAVVGVSENGAGDRGEHEDPSRGAGEQGEAPKHNKSAVR